MSNFPRLMLTSLSSIVVACVAVVVAAAEVQQASLQLHLWQAHGGSVMSESLSPDHAKLATSSRDGTIKIWDVASGKLDRTVTGYTDDVYCVTYSPDGALLASGSGDKSIRLWDAKTFEPVRQLDGHTDI